MTSRDNRSALEIARLGLERLGWDADAIEGVERLEGGLGGAGAYALRMADGRRLVLKARLPDGTESGQAEALFYRHLAGGIPLRTPRVLGVSIDGAGAFILMEAYRPPRPPARWTGAEFQRAARELAGFHATFWGQAEALAEYPFLARRPLVPSDAEVAHARENWAYLGRQERFQGLLTPERLRSLDEGLATVSARICCMDTMPETLIHGDCHVGNVLFSEAGDLVWTDWQGVRIGRGIEDLSFLYQRADVEGGTPDFDSLLTAYHDALCDALPEPPSLTTLRRAAEATEWSVRLVQWPHYLDYASADGMAAFLARLDALCHSGS